MPDRLIFFRMMIKAFSDAELGRLKDELKATAEKNLPAHVRLDEELACIRRSTDALSDYVTAHPFESPAQEIDYHKNIFPVFRCLYIYQVEMHKLEANLPGWGKKALKKYYRAKQQRIRADTESEYIHYTYFRLKADDLDDLYFRADPGRHSVLLPILSEPGECHSTAMGCLFARFRAAELLYSYIEVKLGELDPAAPGKPRRTLKWTGEVINLIEIAYGIHLNSQVENGQIGIVEFFGILGEFFGVNLGVPKKGLDDMAKRKRLSKTHFTDRMRDSILQKMLDDDEWKPGR